MPALIRQVVNSESLNYKLIMFLRVQSNRRICLYSFIFHSQPVITLYFIHLIKLTVLHEKLKCLIYTSILYLKECTEEHLNSKAIILRKMFKTHTKYLTLLNEMFCAVSI